MCAFGYLVSTHFLRFCLYGLQAAFGLPPTFYSLSQWDHRQARFSRVNNEGLTRNFIEVSSERQLESGYSFDQKKNQISQPRYATDLEVQT